MGSSTLFIISTLALLGAAATQYCTTKYMGDIYAEPVPYPEIRVSPGLTMLTFPNDWCGLEQQLVGFKMTACSDYPPAPVVKVQPMQHIFIDSKYGARVDAVAYCSYAIRAAARGRKTSKHHHSQIMLAHNLFQ